MITEIEDIIAIANNVKRATHRVANSGDRPLADLGVKTYRKIRIQKSIPRAKMFETDFLQKIKEKYYPMVPFDKIVPTIVSMSGYDDGSGHSTETTDNTTDAGTVAIIEVADNAAHAQPTDPHGQGPASNTDAGAGGDAYHMDSAIDTLNANAAPLNDYGGHCAAAVRSALEAGGVDTTGHPVDAKDYGGFLESRGFEDAGASAVENPEKGDIVVIQPNADGSHSSGHIAMYDGEKWVSDAEQRNYSAGLRGEYTVYRHGGH